MRTQHRRSRLPAFVVVAAALLLYGCAFPPWEDRYWADDDDAACTDGATSLGLGGAAWVTICGGTYSMGSLESSNEQPVHTVTVPTFEMMMTEVTVSQFAACVDTYGCATPSSPVTGCNWGEASYEDHPMNCVDWEQAVVFCDWAEGRLPSEAEWEYAARGGGQQVTYPWGEEEASCGRAVMMEPGGDAGCDTERTWTVCSMSPEGDTDQGLCDMAGNVWEWVEDSYHSCYACGDCPGETGCDGSSVAPDDGSDWETPASPTQVLRGGGFTDDGEGLRAANRGESDPDEAGPGNGFRCVR
jgi:formylglycine-generating enzyme